MEEKEKKVKLSKPLVASISEVASSYLSPLTWDSNPWTSDEYDKLDVFDLDEYKKVVKDCRYFYKRDPIASTTVNKLIDIGITDLIIDQGTLSDNEYRIIEFVKESLQEFLEQCTLEYLVTGLIVPEIEYTTVTKKILEDAGIKRHSSLLLPSVMWCRDSATIEIQDPLIPAKPSYFVQIPDKLMHFILTGGTYPDGSEDKELYNLISKLYPEMINAIKAGKTKIVLNNDNIIRRKYLTDSPYPIPYLYSALESLRHKRNIRRMDYSIASRVIGAIQLVTLGDKDFPLLEDDEDQLEELRAQMRHRELYNKDIERVFQLFGNHTLKVSWVFPDTAALLDETKYKNVNSDIIYALGMPRILITGETERSGTSDAEFVSQSPMATMKEFRRKLIKLAQKIIEKTLSLNEIKNRPSSVRFDNINLQSFRDFVDALVSLCSTGTVSKTTIDRILGFNFEEETKNRKKEKDLLEEYGLDAFDAVPFSPKPDKKEDVNNKEEDNDRQN